MNKAKLLFGLVITAFIFVACQDSSTPSAPEGPEVKLESRFPEGYKNLLVTGVLTIKNTSSQNISNIKLQLPDPFGITGNNIILQNFPTQQGVYPGLAGNCPPNGTLAAGAECTVDLSGKTSGTDVLKTIDKMATVSYTLDGKAQSQDILLSLKVNDRKELHAQNIKLGQTARSQEQILTNLSNVDEITNITIEPMNPGLMQFFGLNQPKASDLVGVTSFCLKNPNVLKDIVDLKPKHRCMVLFSLKPNMINSKIQQVYYINYKINGKYQQIPFTVEIEDSIPANAPTVFDNNFGPIKIVKGDQKAVQLRISNPALGKKVTNLELEPVKPLKWDPSLELDPNSACVRNKNLAAGSECTYDIFLMPDASDPNYKRQFVLKYKNNLNQDAQFYFDLQGDVSVLPVGTVIPKPSADVPEPVVATITNEYFKYGKRPLKKDAKALGYSDEVISRIPQDTWNYAQHVPWSFKNAHRSREVTKLRDIVPDRIEVDGKKYIKLYHGSTSDAKDAFLKGANNIDFGLAGKVPGGKAAFGDGFYLSSSMNESKNYACLSLSKPGKAAGARGLLLVIGIEDLDIIKGKHQAKSDSTGKSLDGSLYFATGLNNQFVFFDNIRPHLKILKVIELPKGFYMARDNTENDGFDTSDDTPENDATGAYKCSK